MHRRLADAHGSLASLANAPTKCFDTPQRHLPTSYALPDVKIGGMCWLIISPGQQAKWALPLHCANCVLQHKEGQPLPLRCFKELGGVY